MKYLISMILLLILFNNSSAQISKIAILDFENTSGNMEYDGLGKALSNMLITDLRNNIHPRKVELFERSQLNKLLDEQKLQKSKNFDPKTAVSFGKLSGVNYIFVGAIFVINGNCNISSKLIDVQSSKILIAKEVNGRIDDFMKLKSQLAETIAITINNPFSLDPMFKEQVASLVTLNQYAKLLTFTDTGDIEKAEEFRKVFEETNPEFKYFLDLKDDLEILKKQVAKNTANIDLLNQAGGRVINAKSLIELINNITNPLSPFEDRKEIMTEILKNNPQEIRNIIGDFKNICNQPGGLELLLSYDSDQNPTEKTFELYAKSMKYINSLFENNLINKITFSHYAFYYLRMFANFKKKLVSTDLEIISNAILVCENLRLYNLKNEINSYDLNNFGGETNYSFFNGDKDLTIEHLINLLKN